MPNEFTYTFDTELYKESVTFNTGLFIDGEFVDPVEAETIEYVYSFVMSLRNKADIYPIDSVVNPGMYRIRICVAVLTMCLATGKVITSVAGASAKDVDLAVKAASKVCCHRSLASYDL